MSHTISRSNRASHCEGCQVVDLGSYDEEYGIRFCPLHEAAEELLAALKAAVSDLDDWAASDDEREYDVTPEGLRELSRELAEAITHAERRTR